jgi:hypothetical protein
MTTLGVEILDILMAGITLRLIHRLERRRFLGRRLRLERAGQLHGRMQPDCEQRGREAQRHSFPNTSYIHDHLLVGIDRFSVQVAQYRTRAD